MKRALVAVLLVLASCKSDGKAKDQARATPAPPAPAAVTVDAGAKTAEGADQEALRKEIEARAGAGAAAAGTDSISGQLAELDRQIEAAMAALADAKTKAETDDIKAKLAALQQRKQELKA